MFEGLHHSRSFQRSSSHRRISQLRLNIESFLDLIHQKNFKSSVPQDSVIGLLTFIIFVNDLLDALEALALPFADDAKMANRTRAQKITFTNLVLPHESRGRSGTY